MAGPRAATSPSVRRWFVVVGAITLATAGAGSAVGAALRDRLPAEVASHYGTDGVDATQPLDRYLATAALVMIGITLLMGALGAAMPGDARRVLGCSQAVLTAVLGSALYGSLIGHLDLDDARAATGPGPGRWLAAGLVAGGLVAVPVWRLLTPSRLERPPPGLEWPPPAPSGGDPALIWTGRTGWSVGAPVVIALLVALAVGFAVWLGLWAGMLPAAVAVSMVAMLQGRVRVDRDGLRVSSLGRATWVSIPLGDIAEAEADVVSPLRDFGGYGVRYGLRGRGFVTRAGEALRVESRDGTSTWVTVDDAARGAATVNALLAGQGGTTAGPTP